jgi:hypothetical protein
METKLEDILANYDIEAPERTIRKEVCAVLNDILNTDFSVENIRYQKGSIWVDTGPMVRSQIHLKKGSIKTAISQRIKSRNISDIH